MKNPFLQKVFIMDIEQRIDDLLKQMSTEEKITLLKIWKGWTQT